MTWWCLVRGHQRLHHPHPGDLHRRGRRLDSVGDTGTWSFTLIVSPTTLAFTLPLFSSIFSSPGGGTGFPGLAGIGGTFPGGGSSSSPVPTQRELNTVSGVGANWGLSLGGSNTLVPGQTATVTGAGCDANAPVTLTLNGSQVGSATASARGDFSTTISPPALVAGQYELQASCGPTLTTTLALVVSSSSSKRGEQYCGIRRFLGARTCPPAGSIRFELDGAPQAAVTQR